VGCLGQYQDADSLKVCVFQYMTKSALPMKCPVVYFDPHTAEFLILIQTSAKVGHWEVQKIGEIRERVFCDVPGFVQYSFKLVSCAETPNCSRR